MIDNLLSRLLRSEQRDKDEKVHSILTTQRDTCILKRDLGFGLAMER